jgi:hypothetical protein
MFIFCAAAEHNKKAIAAVDTNFFIRLVSDELTNYMPVENESVPIVIRNESGREESKCRGKKSAYSKLSYIC